jgi:hypothetical protein
MGAAICQAGTWQTGVARRVSCDPLAVRVPRCCATVCVSTKGWPSSPGPGCTPRLLLSGSAGDSVLLEAPEVSPAIKCMHFAHGQDTILVDDLTASYLMCMVSVMS